MANEGVTTATVRLYVYRPALIPAVVDDPGLIEGKLKTGEYFVDEVLALEAFFPAAGNGPDLFNRSVRSAVKRLADKLKADCRRVESSALLPVPGADK